MTSIYSVGGIFLVALFLCVGISAQNETKQSRFQEAKVRSLSKPDYPKVAKETGLSGKVSVRVSIDETGKVTLADDATGPGWVCPTVTALNVVALRNAAIKAALRTKFSPATEEGKPVSSTMRLDFDFQLPEKRTKPEKKDKVENYSVANAPDYTGPVVGDRNLSTASIPEKAEVFRTEPAEKDRYTIVGSGLSTTSAAANDASSRGVLNGKAIKLPKPPYPRAARAVRASGLVVIQVLIIEDGTLFSAEPVSGHPLLRSASRIAACGARFSPTMLSGRPVKVSGVITYNFVP